MKLRVQYNDAEGEDRVAWESRLKGAENDRDGALSAATESILDMDKADVSDRTRECVEAVVERGKFKFEDKETFGEYMRALQLLRSRVQLCWTPHRIIWTWRRTPAPPRRP